MIAMPIILESLPKTATLRKLNDLIKRARLAKVLFELFFFTNERSYSRYML